MRVRLRRSWQSLDVLSFLADTTLCVLHTLETPSPSISHILTATHCIEFLSCHHPPTSLLDQHVDHRGHRDARLLWSMDWCWVPSQSNGSLPQRHGWLARRGLPAGADVEPGGTVVSARASVAVVVMVLSSSWCGGGGCGYQHGVCMSRHCVLISLVLLQISASIVLQVRTLQTITLACLCACAGRCTSSRRPVIAHANTFLHFTR